jgi:hypothetical protein
MAITEHTRRRLFAASGGYCANPECPSPELFRDVDEEHVPHVANVAHVIAESKAGPRGEEPLDEHERAAFENLVLLCANCHKIVDDMKLLGRYSIRELLRWKHEHQARVAAQFQALELSDRDALVHEVARLLRQNHAIWHEYGPDSEGAMANPGADVAGTWRREAREHILPNNREILALVDRNARFLEVDELNVVEHFRVHARAFARTQLGDPEAGAPRFPAEMREIFASR